MKSVIGFFCLGSFLVEWILFGRTRSDTDHFDDGLFPRASCIYQMNTASAEIQSGINGIHVASNS